MIEVEDKPQSKSALPRSDEASSMAERLQLAEETISILNTANGLLNDELTALKSDFTVLEGLLIESGQTLQRLQEMYHREKESNGKLFAALEKANAKILELEGGTPSNEKPSDPTRNVTVSGVSSPTRNSSALLSKLMAQATSPPAPPQGSSINLADAVTKALREKQNRPTLTSSPSEFSSEPMSPPMLRAQRGRVSQDLNTSTDSITNTNSNSNSNNNSNFRSGRSNKSEEQFDLHKYHLNVRDALRNLAEGLCDELVRVEENLEKIQPLVIQTMKEEAEELAYSGVGGSDSSSSGRRSGSRSPVNTSYNEPDFLFGSPSLRMPVLGEVVPEGDEGEEH